SLQDQVNLAIEQYAQDREERLVELSERLDRRVAWLRDGDVTGFEEEDFFWIDDLERDRSAEEEDEEEEEGEDAVEAPPKKRVLTDADKRAAESELRKEIDASMK